MKNVKLISWTRNPLQTIYWAFMNMHNPVPDDLSKIELSQEELESFFEMLMEQPHQTVLEYVKTVWYIEDGSRAFQQQLTRTRQASYSIQSLRIVNVGSFASDSRYEKSSKIRKNKAAEELYDDTMVLLQQRYKQLLDMGCPVEDARGILPLNIHSPITLAIDLRSLYHMMELRFCDNAQEEYRKFAECVKSEIVRKMHPIFGKPMRPICESVGYCPSPVPCGKYKQRKVMDVSRWIKG